VFRLASDRKLQIKDGSQSIIDRFDEGPGQSARTLPQPCAIDQLQSERHCNGVGGQAGHCSVEQDIAGEASPIEIRGERHNMGLPDVDIENVTSGNHDTRPTLVEIDPIHPATHYHGADRSIRSPTAMASSGVNPSAAASAASATSWSANDMVDWSAWRRSCSVTHLENGTCRLSMIGTTSSGTLIVLLGTYVLYVLITADVL